MYGTVLSPVPREAADTHMKMQQVASPTAGGSKTALTKLAGEPQGPGGGGRGRQLPRSAANKLVAEANHLHTRVCFFMCKVKVLS